jgi:hypothetical protein
VCIRRTILCGLLVIPATAPCAQIDTPEQVHPSTGTFEQLRKASTDVAQTVGEHLDEGHDWIYRRIERWLEGRGTSGAPVVMRLSKEESTQADLPWLLLGVHSARLDVGTRDLQLDEALGLNCAWYADILLTLTEH